MRRALDDPLGGPLGRLFHVPAMTAIVADGRDEDHEVIALEELIAALARVGVPRGRQYVLLAHPGDTPADARERTRRLRAILGVPVLAHDPARSSGYVPGALPDGTPLELDDELREAEEVVLMGPCAAPDADGAHGGAALLWPGLGSAAARTAHAAHPAAAGADLALARAVLAHVPSAFALWWNADAPPRVRAGETLALLEECVGEGWFGMR